MPYQIQKYVISNFPHSRTNSHIKYTSTQISFYIFIITFKNIVNTRAYKHSFIFSYTQDCKYTKTKLIKGTNTK